jgi:TP901 family phage tail tape measure protein
MSIYIDTVTSKMNAGFQFAENKLKAFSQRMKSSGLANIAVGVTLGAPMYKALKVFAAFDDQMRLVKGVTSSTEQEFDALTETAKYLGRTTSYTASQVAGAMVELGRAGFRSKEIQDSIAPLLNMARATGTDLSESALIASGTLRAFNMDASRMTEVADIMTVAANSSAQTLSDLGDSMKYAAPVAQDFGMSLKQTTKAIATMANFSIRGSMAGTSLRMMMLRLVDPEVRKKLNGIGVSITDTSGAMKDATAIMQELHGALKNLPKADQLGIMSDLFGARAVSGGLKLATANFKEMNAAIDNAFGGAKKVAKEMDAGIGGSLRILLSSVEGVTIAIGEGLAPMIKSMADWFANALDPITRFIEQNSWIAKTIAIVAGSLVVMGTAMLTASAATWTIAKAIGYLSTTLRVLGVALNFLFANPIILAITAIAGLAAAAIHFFGVGDTFIDKVKNIGMSIYSFLKPAIDYVKASISSLLVFLSPVFEGIKKVVIAAWGAVQRATYKVWEGVKSAVTPVLQAIWGLMKSMGNYISTTWARLWGAMASPVKSAFYWVRDIIVKALDHIAFSFDNFELVVEWAFYSFVYNVVKGFWEIIHMIKQIPIIVKWMADNWKDIFATLWSYIKNFAINLSKNLKNLWDAIAGFFSGEGWHFAGWIDLTKGVENSIKELPKIAEREIGKTEASLKRTVDRLALELKKRWDSRFKGGGFGIFDWIKSGLDQIRKLAIEGVNKMTNLWNRLEGAVPKDVLQKTTKASGVRDDKRPSLASAMERGSAEAYTAAMTGDRYDSAKKTAKNTEDTTKELKKVNSNLAGGLSVIVNAPIIDLGLA